MIKSFNNYLSQIVDNYQETKYLLAVSGGMDSMLMLWLFQQSDLSFAVANINFNLRGIEADNDSQLVIDYCEHYNIPYYHKHFNTIAYSKENKISIQMAARDLRYKWFEQLAQQHHFQKISIAHHLDDQTETFFINLIRGTGIAGLHGLARNKANIIRPLMFCTRKDIASAIQKYTIPYREDSSNASDKYQRNYIRHNILPHFYHLQANFSHKLDKTIQYISELEDFTNHYIQIECKDIILSHQENSLTISLKKLQLKKHKHILLYSLLKEYNFSRDHIDTFVFLLSELSSGKEIQSSTHRIIFDRDSAIIIAKEENKALISIPINSLSDKAWDENQLSYENNYSGNYKTKNKNIAFLDYKLLHFPLSIRPWQHGDTFQPLGMKGKKKVSDFFIDIKLSKVQKEKTLLLCQGKEIIWIIGHRIDNRFAVTEETTQILKIEYHGNN